MLQIACGEIKKKKKIYVKPKKIDLHPRLEVIFKLNFNPQLEELIILTPLIPRIKR
jgi:hypothetical protein